MTAASRRSCLVVPGNQARMHKKALSAEADDLAMCAQLDIPSLTLVVPKVESAADLIPAAGVARLQALIETPAGLADATHIARSEAVVSLILGYADLAAALGRRNFGGDPARWLVAQETLLAAARRADVQVIDGPVSY